MRTRGAAEGQRGLPVKDGSSPDFNYERCHPQINGKGGFCFLFFLFLTPDDSNSRKHSPSGRGGQGGMGWAGGDRTLLSEGSSKGARRVDKRAPRGGHPHCHLPALGERKGCATGAWGDRRALGPRVQLFSVPRALPRA